MFNPSHTDTPVGNAIANNDNMLEPGLASPPLRASVRANLNDIFDSIANEDNLPAESDTQQPESFDEIDQHHGTSIPDSSLIQQFDDALDDLIYASPGVATQRNLTWAPPRRNPTRSRRH